MAKNKTVPNKEDVRGFINKLADEQKRKDCFQLLQIIQEITGEPPVIWGNSIIGFGTYHYKYDSGREGDFFIAGFSPRKQNISIYLMAGLDKFEKELTKLGKHKIGKSCLYIKSLETIDEEVLKDMIKTSVNLMRKRYQ